MNQKRVYAKTHRDLVLALESARTRLAVATASEAKSTPPERWRYYLDTSDRARRLIKSLRKADWEVFQEKKEWMRAIDVLKQAADGEEAFHLCRILHEVVKDLSE